MEFENYLKFSREKLKNFTKTISVSQLHTISLFFWQLRLKSNENVNFDFRILEHEKMYFLAKCKLRFRIRLLKIHNVGQGLSSDFGSLDLGYF